MIHLSGSYRPRVCGIADYLGCLVESLGGGTVWSRSEAFPDFGPEGFRQIAKRLRRERPALVHFQYERTICDDNPDFCTKLPGLVHGYGGKLVTTFHALDGPRSWGRAHRLALVPLLLGSDAVLVCSRKQLSATRRIPGLARKTHLTPIGNVVPVTGKRRERAPGDPLRLVYFGFLWHGRNVEVLLQALKAVIEADVPATLTLVGLVKEPSYRIALERLADELGVAERVCFTGEATPGEISQWLADADLCLLPFATGVSTGRTTLTAALAHGAPVVTMMTPGNLDDAFLDGENLLLAPVSDEAAYVAQVVRAARDETLRDRLRNGSLVLSDRFSWPTLASQVSRIYEELT